MRFDSLPTTCGTGPRKPAFVLALAALVTALIGVWPAVAGATTMSQIRFLGWSPSSREMAYELLEIDAKKKSSRKSVLKALDGKMRLKPKKLGTKSLGDYVKEHKFVVEALTAKKEGAYVTLLSRKTREMVRVELVVKEKLGFRIEVKAKNKKWKLARRGNLDDLYNDVEAAGFVSPDGLKVTVVLRLRTPYALRDMVFVVVTRH